jgi:hypothetical protein
VGWTTINLILWLTVGWGCLLYLFPNSVVKKFLVGLWLISSSWKLQEGENILSLHPLHIQIDSESAILNEEPAKLNRDMRAVWPNSLFSNVVNVFSWFMSQNNPLVLVGFYQNLYHHASKAKFSICHWFFVRKICRTLVVVWYRQCFLFGKIL